MYNKIEYNYKNKNTTKNEYQKNARLKIMPLLSTEIIFSNKCF